ncbi:Predicted chitinase [Mycobacteroides abscessus subsp. abscessus]|uniref:glycoside hydrolase family 19 protein n=1 Tax=Mycobacteroides abscessus TaxID=36809 RepID=UPI0009D61C61|nr:glycoside hydrolase family 19 protein [Mycobacteroides abscessus]SKE08592.1 Predicted chitinase [Mycobacteroides abscessus subsp. abscessus]
MPETHKDHPSAATVITCRDLAADSESHQVTANPAAHSDAGRHVISVIAGAVLLVAAVAGLHGLYRAGDSLGDLAMWAAPLLLWFSCLGGGIKLAMWGARPVTAAVFDAAKDRLSEPAYAVAAAGGVIVGALGMWFTFRDGYSTWWQQVSGETAWSLMSGVGQMLVAVAAGAALFSGGRYLFGLAKEALVEAGLLSEHDRTARPGHDSASHPALTAALIAGGAGLVILTAWLTPTLAPTIVGTNALPAVGAIAAVLVWAVGANLGWWHGLSGLHTWATAASQKASATAAVIAVLMFSAGGLGLGWFTPATVPQAHAACPPDCGGGGGLDGPPGGGQMFQPPSQGGQQLPDYNSGNYGRPALDQNSGISIYNENPASGQIPSQTGGQQSMQEPPFRANPDGSWQARNGEWSPPNYQTASPGLTQGPGRPNPDFPGNQAGQANPGSQGGNQAQQQPAQQVPRQAPEQPQQAPQQPNQQPQQSDSQKIDDLTRQLQEKQQQSSQDRQRIDDMTKQLQQNQKQSPKFPSNDKKKDDKDEQDDREKQSGDNDLAALLMGAASTRRRKQDEQEQGPDTQALGQDASQAVQGLPGDVQTYVQSGQQIGESSGQAAQGFGSAAQAGASLASSAQSGAVNPQDAITLVQGVSQGIQGTADAVNAGSQIVKTAQGEADQVAQAVGDANPQLKPQMEQFTQLNDTVSKGTDLVGQGAQLTSQASGAVNSVSSMDPSAVQAVDLQSGQAPAEMVGWEVAASGPSDVGGGDPGGQGVTPRFIDPNTLIPPPDPKAGITAEQLQAIMPDLSESDVAKYIGPLNQAMLQGGIDTPRRQAAFLAQVAVESEQLKYWEELGDEEYFRSFLGEDWMYHGRGPIQLTHSSTYLRAGQELGLGDLLLKNPDLVSQPDMGFRTSIWFWEGGNPPGVNLNDLADQATPTDGLDFFRQITVLVRGDTGPGSHYDRRIQFFEKAFAELGAK